jgi:hypothetical protein
MASEPGGGPPLPSPVVLYDANLLYPFHLRNLLVQLGVDGLVAPRWTDRIHDEWVGSLAATGKVARERLLRTRDIMRRVLPRADVTGYEHRIAALALPDRDDRHVLAAAVEAGASVILTLNLRDFPAGRLAPFGIVARHPDDLLCELHDADPEAVRASAEAAHANLSRSAPSFGAFLDALAHQGLPAFAGKLRTR